MKLFHTKIQYIKGACQIAIKVCTGLLSIPVPIWLQMGETQFVGHSLSSWHWGTHAALLGFSTYSVSLGSTRMKMIHRCVID